MASMDSEDQEKQRLDETGHSNNDPPHCPEYELEYPPKPTLVVLTVALMMAVFMVALDTNIIGTALPHITTRFHSLDDIGWYGSAYLLTQLSLQASYGKLYTYFNIKWIYMMALFVFEIGSIVCATAPSSTVFIIGRAVAGTGAAGIASGSLTIGGKLVPLRQAPLYIALVSSMYGVAAAAGPLLGGVFTDSARLTWRFCFWLNLPFGGLAILVIFLVYKAPQLQNRDVSLREKLSSMDLSGALFLISALVCLLLTLQWGGITRPWSDSKVWGCLLGFVLLLSVFITLQYRRQNEATVPPRILLQRSMAIGCLFVCFVNMAIDLHIYYLPFYFQAAKGTSAQGSGVRILPYLITVFLTAIVAGTFMTFSRLYYPIMWFGAAVLTSGCTLIQTLRVTSGAGQWIGYQILCGIGFGMAFQVPYTIVQVVLEPNDVPTGNALVVFFQALGGALAVSIAQNIFGNELDRQLVKLSPEQVPNIIAAGATSISTKVPVELQGSVREAYSFALSRAFILPVVAAGAALLSGLGIERRIIETTNKKQL